AAPAPSHVARPADGPRHPGPVLDGVRQRRLVDLLRARRHRDLRARHDADHVPDLGRDLRVHGVHLRRGHGPVPRGGRVGVVRPPGLQRGGLVLRRLGPDAQLHDHDRHLGVQRPAVPLRLPRARRAARRGAQARIRDRAVRAARPAQHPGDPGVRPAEHPAGPRRPRHAGAPRARRRRADPVAVGADRERPLGRGADPQELPDLDPDRHGRLHRHRDHLEHGGGGSRPRARRAALDRARGARGLRDLRLPAGRRALRAARPRGAVRASDDRVAVHVPARHHVRGRPRGGHRAEPRPRRADDAGRPVRGPAGGHDPADRHERGHHRRLPADLLDGRAPAVPALHLDGPPDLPHPVARDHALHGRGRGADAPEPAGVPREPVRVRGDALVHRRPRGRDRPPPAPARSRPAVPGAVQRPRPGLRRPALRGLRRARDAGGVPRHLRPLRRRALRGARLDGARDDDLRPLPAEPGAAADRDRAGGAEGHGTRGRARVQHRPPAPHGGRRGRRDDRHRPAARGRAGRPRRRRLPRRRAGLAPHGRGRSRGRAGRPAPARRGRGARRPVRGAGDRSHHPHPERRADARRGGRGARLGDHRARGARSRAERDAALRRHGRLRPPPRALQGDGRRDAGVARTAPRGPGGDPV
ncbi:MAG: amino acid permease-associated region, partial [uncultured Thermoleophilia bacterium]